MLGQDDEGEIRPRRLGQHPFGELAYVGAAQGFFGDDGSVRALLDLAEQLGEVEADVGADPGVAQDALGDDRIAAPRSENERPLGRRCSDQGLPPRRGTSWPT